jgi:hypothetical protein
VAARDRSAARPELTVIALRFLEETGAILHFDAPSNSDKVNEPGRLT